ncbi:hypothetical protein [Pseudoalteromonas sp. GB56]
MIRRKNPSSLSEYLATVTHELFAPIKEPITAQRSIFYVHKSHGNFHPILHKMVALKEGLNI